MVEIRLAVIDRGRCSGARCGYVCQKACPVQRLRRETITIDASGWPIINEELCTGCGVCIKKCPMAAIKVIRLPSRPGRALFSYGPNSFCLYGFPLPVRGVVGLIGSNGIGKSTALALIAGIASPNLGRWGEVPSDEELKSFSRQAWSYFTSLKKGAIRAVIKPQRLQRFESSERVGDALARCDERGAGDEVVNALRLGALLGKELRELGGGELQLFEIAKASLRRADVYCFDEPSSYLDGAARLRAAALIRSLARGARVVVVEHDLVAADYLCDYVYVLWGAKGVYGVVSSLKGVGAGINEWLNGYLRAENVRIRAQPIRFELSPARFAESAERITYGAMVKRWPGFELRCEGGSLPTSTIVAAIGPNAIGKTTFARLLIGELEPDEGTCALRATIAYKPQLVTPPGGRVGEFLSGLVDMDEFLLNHLIELFELKPLLDQECSSLSGGELQRLLIATTLSSNAALKVLDEPTAFLDVEERLLLGREIRRIAERGSACLLIDHDLLFVASCASAVLLFSGEPGRRGFVKGALPLSTGLNALLEELGITLRRDAQTHRLRVNKPGSVLDREQRARGEYFSMR